MARKQKAVFTAEPDQMRRVDTVVRNGRYRSTSEFLRDAIDRHLAALESEAIAEQVERYCAAGCAEEDGGLVDAQAFDEDG